MQKKEIKELKAVSFSCRCIFLGIALIIIGLDQLSKYIARSNLVFATPKLLTNYWNWALNYNQGAAFSFLANEASWSKIVFGVIAVIVSIGLIYYILYRRYSIMNGLALSFILGGAVGNLVDRIIFGRVTDFIDWHYVSYHWPTFNVADSFITIGVVFLIAESIFKKKID
jgi:signal peptidase II